MCMYMIFRSGTCANWAQLNASTSLEGEVRGSGGVGVLIRGSVKHYQIEILEAEIEDMLWAKLNQGEEEKGLVLAVCYVPPESSSCGRSSEECFQILAEQVASLECLDHLALS